MAVETHLVTPRVGVPSVLEKELSSCSLAQVPDGSLPSIILDSGSWSSAQSTSSSAQDADEDDGMMMPPTMDDDCVDAAQADDDGALLPAVPVLQTSDSFLAPDDGLVISDDDVLSKVSARAGNAKMQTENCGSHRSSPLLRPT